MRPGKVEVIIAYAMDRLSRNQHHLSVHVREAERHLLDPLTLLAPRENISEWASVHVNKTATTAGILRIPLSREVTNTARSVGIAVTLPMAKAKGLLASGPPASELLARCPRELLGAEAPRYLGHPR